MAQRSRARLDEIASTVPISASQSASIACEVAGRLERWIRTKDPASIVVPTFHDITITRSGSLWWWRGRSVPPARAIREVGDLLCTLLQYVPSGRTPAGLLYVAARATEPGHLAPFGDLGELYSALARYGGGHRHLAMDALLAQYQIARSGLPALGAESSISDVRRLRRAGGVALAQIAGDTGIPISLLRELEWGVYTNWNLAHAGSALARYADRAGLDPAAVAHVIVREQALSVTARASVREKTAAGQRHRFLPFGLAAALVAMCLAGTPDDVRMNVTPAVFVQQTTITTTTVQPRPISLTTAASPRQSQDRVRPGASRAARPAPRRVRTASSVSRPTASPAKTSAALIRFAKAIAGDGRYRVEPFPRPR